MEEVLCFVCFVLFMAFKNLDQHLWGKMRRTVWPRQKLPDPRKRMWPKWPLLRRLVKYAKIASEIWCLFFWKKSEFSMSFFQAASAAPAAGAEAAAEVATTPAALNAETLEKPEKSEKTEKTKKKKAAPVVNSEKTCKAFGWSKACHALKHTPTIPHCILQGEKWSDRCCRASSTVQLHGYTEKCTRNVTSRAMF